MTATETRLSCHLRKFETESRPPPMLRRDDRIRSVASSFEEILESEEEEILEMPVSCSSAARSPYAVQSESPFSQRRSNSLTHSALVSPKLTKRFLPPRLIRGFSDPVVRRRCSLTSLHSPDRSSAECSTDVLALPPIPETPASPVTGPTNNVFKETNNNSVEH